jgi:diadenosine tetraphosphate (Ap4A) HIT family hydrolase
MNNEKQTLIHVHVEEARRGDNPRVIKRLKSGWAVMGEVQFLKGYCLLLPDPVVPSLNDLEIHARDLFLREMAMLGDAIQATVNCRRLNYEILGNVEPALHAHVFPRFCDEDPEYRQKPVWFYDWKKAPAFDLVKDNELMNKLRFQLDLLSGS